MKIKIGWLGWRKEWQQLSVEQRDALLTQHQRKSDVLCVVAVDHCGAVGAIASGLFNLWHGAGALW